jgi:hypothetical protein
MINIKKPMKAQTPKKSHLYRKYDEITLDHCKLLLVHLYGGKVGSWVNPITGNTINNGSYITISFLSKCYYVWGNKIATINSKKLKYKKHIEKFIAKEYLFDIPLYMQHIRGGAGSPVGSPIYPSPPPPNPPMGAAIMKANSPSKSPPPSYDEGIKTESKLKFTQKNKDIAETMNTSFNMTKENCESLLANIKMALDNNAEIITDPLDNTKTKTINIRSPKLLLYLSKCYYTFDDTIKIGVNEIVDFNVLIDLTDEKRLAIPIIDGKLNEYIELFNTFCEELKNNCDANGILKDHKYISNIVNAILVVICTKYLHLYNKISPTTYDNPLQIYMYDDTIEYDYFKKNYNGIEINDGMRRITTHTIYQKDDLMQTQEDTQIDLKPKTIDKYKENTLYNRQYVFELLKKDTKMNITYNIINKREDTFEQTFDLDKLATTLEYAYELLFNKNPFNYNITNSILPKKIKIECSNTSVLSHFVDILNTINAKLEQLVVVISGVRSKTDPYYNSVIFDMKLNGFGYNELIRKNILYSLNAQDPSYIKKYIVLYKEGNPTKDFYKDELFYNYGYTGSFPLFTWIPISQSEPDGTIYNFPSSSKWQPYGVENTAKFRVVDAAYKNYYVQPFSKSLNETIYKVISDEEGTIVNDGMMKRINETIGIYKDIDRAVTYTNKKIYLYHGTNTKLHNMDGKLDDIEILGFLSTSLNVYVASFYSEAASMRSSGFIYIIEVDNEQTYINLNDHLYQFILLPHSIIRILCTFYYMGITIILCRLIKTPTKEQSNKLYDKLFDNNALAFAKVANFYYIMRNDNVIPICAGFKKPEDFKISQSVKWNSDYCDTKITDEYMDIFQIPRKYLDNKILPSDNKLYVYFSLLQENELYLIKGEKTAGVYGGFDDIKYSIHQHFIKDCYKLLKIPCIDYAFFHEDKTTKNAIATGILLDDYEKNRNYEYKYDINNFLIDCIFNFDSIDNENKKLDLPDVDNGSDVSENLYADKIEGFRNAGLYINGIIKQDFSYNEEEERNYIFNYVKRYKNFFSKYRDADDENLIRHFKCYNAKLIRLMGIIDYLKDQYLKFINEILKPNPLSNSSKNELKQLNKMLNKLADTLRLRAFYYFKLTRDADNGVLIGLIRKAFSEEPARDIPVPKGAVITDLKLCDDDDGQLGGKHSAKNKVGKVGKSMVISSFVDKLGIEGMKEKGARKSSGTNHEKERLRLIEETNHKIKEKIRNVLIEIERKGLRKSSGTKREEANKEINASISQYNSMHIFEDLPEDFQKYYGEQNKGTMIDISNGCHIRLVVKKDY